MDKRIYPCIDVAASGTRREELLLDRKELELVYRLRKVLADMNVAEKYAELVPDRNDAERVFAMIRHEHARTSKVVLELNGAKVLCERFSGFRRRFERLRPMVDQANLWQVQLLRETRAGKSKTEINKPLLMTMNCVAQGLGWTG